MKRGQVTPATFANRRVRIERAADRLIFAFPLGVGEAWRLQKRYRRKRGKLFVCLHREDTEPANNSSERDLRISVIHDNVTGGCRSRRGAEQGAILATLLITARKLGQNAYQRLCSTAGPSPLHTAGWLPQELPALNPFWRPVGCVWCRCPLGGRNYQRNYQDVTSVLLSSRSARMRMTIAARLAEIETCRWDETGPN